MQSLTYFVVLSALLIFKSIESVNIEIENQRDTQLWWLAFYIRNADNTCNNPITAVEIKDHTNYNNWVAVSQTPWDADCYQLSNINGQAFTTPISIKIITASEPNGIIYNDIITSFFPNEKFDFGRNLCSSSAPTALTSNPSPAPTITSLAPTITTPSPISPPGPAPAPPSNTCSGSKPHRCGSSWTQANAHCGQCCNDNSDCTAIASENQCYADLDSSPCGPAPAPAPGGPILPVISSCGTGQYISLTFDDGPSTYPMNNGIEPTQLIINALDAHGIKATFYVAPAANGESVNELQMRCDLIAELAASGHEIGSHSWSHPNFQDEALSNEMIQIQLDNTKTFIEDCGGIAEPVFRPPYGALSKEQAEYIAHDLGYTLGLWNLDSNDWRHPNDFDGISSGIDLNNYGGNSITMLMHDHSVCDIIDEIINLFNNGWTFITQSECYDRCDTKIDGVCEGTYGDWWQIDEWRPSP